MRFIIQLTIFGALFAALGCGAKPTEPKGVNVKEDPRLQRTKEGAATKSGNQLVSAK